MPVKNVFIAMPVYDGTAKVVVRRRCQVLPPGAGIRRQGVRRNLFLTGHMGNHQFPSLPEFTAETGGRA